VDSFFDIFENYQIDVEEMEDIENDDEIFYDERIQQEYKNGLFIKDKLIASAIEFYLGLTIDEFKFEEDSVES
jgi:hypothetical protein